ncbi:MAG TPA: [Fe-S]-binding protein [Planctomycetaceae bacterium]|nr:[Fe-S]-binding protein [Planctomycetaceae bacterium]
MKQLPSFFRVRQTFPRPRLDDLPGEVVKQLKRLQESTTQRLEGKRIAVTAGSRGIANIATILRASVDWLKTQGCEPFVVPAMGSHGNASVDGQLAVLKSLGVTEESLGCPIHGSMDVVEVCHSELGFPIFIDRHAAEADGVLVVNRIKPHTRFHGDIESGLMKMMLIGLGNARGAELYHQAIVQSSFGAIVRSVATQVIEKCGVIGGLAILENGYEETTRIVGVPPKSIIETEPKLLDEVKALMPSLPFDQADFLVIDRMGKNISGTGIDTNIVGRKRNDNAAIGDERPDIHHIYVRSLTEQTNGNASGIGVADLCHQRVLEQINLASTRKNCITAGHISGAKLPVDFSCDREAITTACQLAGYLKPEQVRAMWIRDTLSLDEVACSSGYLSQAQASSHLEILSDPQPLEFDESGNLEFLLD